MFLSKFKINFEFLLSDFRSLYLLDEKINDIKVLPIIFKFYSVSPFFLNNFGDWMTIILLIIMISLVFKGL